MRFLRMGSSRGLIVTPLCVVAIYLGACREVGEELPPGSRSQESLVAGGESLYLVEAQAGDFLEVVVKQQGVDLVVEVDGPSGESLGPVDGPGRCTPERFVAVAEVAGNYSFNVRSWGEVPGTDEFEIVVEELRPATERDRLVAAAATAFYDAVANVSIADLSANLEDWKALEEDSWQVKILWLVGYLDHEQAGDFELALESYGEALALAVEPCTVASLRQNMGTLHRRLDDLEPARQALTRALADWQDLGHLRDRHSEATAANDLGLVYKLLRDTSTAIDNYDMAVDGWRGLGDRAREAVSLFNRGRAYASQGQYDRAIEDLESSLEIRTQLDSARGQAMALTGLGQVRRDLDELDEALELLESALELRGSNRRGRAVTLAGLGEVHFLLGDEEKARAELEEALAIFRELGELRNEANVLLILGLLDDEDDPESATAYYRSALEIFRRVEDRDRVAAGLLGLARAERTRGRLEAALELVSDALDIIEDLRQETPGDDMRSAYFATKQNYFDFKIAVLMELDRREPEAGHAERALQVSERARARSQLDTLVQGDSLRPDQATPLLHEEVELLRLIEAEQFLLTEKLLGDAESEEVDASRRRVRDLIGQLDDLRGRIRRDHPLHSQVTRPEILSARRIQEQIVDDETLFLEYQLGEESSYLWAVTSDSVDTYELPAQDVVELLASRTAQLLRFSNRDENRAALQYDLADLSDLLLGPVADKLDKERLVIVAEGALQYVPFAALLSPASRTDGSSPALVEDHQIVSLPSASLLQAMRHQYAAREVPDRDVAVFADPVFRSENDTQAGEASPARGEDSRLGPDLVELPHTREEAEAILSLFPQDRILRALGFRAVKETAISAALRDYRYVHIATHGYLDSQFPELSSLVFSLVNEDGQQRDGFLRAHEVYQLDLLAELVVLSACETALGKEILGEGLSGWTQGFIYSGAKRVLVSLWAVDDEVTAELMKSFYYLLIKEGLTPAAALRQAQAEIRQNPNWRAPYFWAAFILQGEFK